MKALKQAREQKGFSQRRLAKRAGLSYKSLQLLEGGGHDPKLSTLQNVATAFGFPPNAVERCLARLFSNPADSVAVVSENIVRGKEGGWTLWLFQFVDAFRLHKDPRYAAAPPAEETPEKIKALLAAAVETLCDEMGMPAPWWCVGMPVLAEPWFVAGIENLKATALVESPVPFRKRNIFVLGNFLERR